MFSFLPNTSRSAQLTFDILSTSCLGNGLRCGRLLPTGLINNWLVKNLELGCNFKTIFLDLSFQADRTELG